MVGGRRFMVDDIVAAVDEPDAYILRSQNLEVVEKDENKGKHRWMRCVRTSPELDNSGCHWWLREWRFVGGQCVG